VRGGGEIPFAGLAGAHLEGEVELLAKARAVALSLTADAGLGRLLLLELPLCSRLLMPAQQQRCTARKPAYPPTQQR
jgi:hypothetical protein